MSIAAKMVALCLFFVSTGMSLGKDRPIAGQLHYDEQQLRASLVFGLDSGIGIDFSLLKENCGQRIPVNEIFGTVRIAPIMTSQGSGSAVREGFPLKEGKGFIPETAIKGYRGPAWRGDGLFMVEFHLWRRDLDLGSHRLALRVRLNGTRFVRAPLLVEPPRIVCGGTDKCEVFVLTDIPAKADIRAKREIYSRARPATEHRIPVPSDVLNATSLTVCLDGIAVIEFSPATLSESSLR